MNTKRLWPEIIVSGFFYLVAFTFFALWLLGWNGTSIECLIRKLGKYQVDPVILSALALGGSYLLGNLFWGLEASIFRLVGRYRDRREKESTKRIDEQDEALCRMLSNSPQALAEALESRYAGKLFFGSMAFAVLVLMSCSAPWGICSSEARVSCTTWLFVILLESGFQIAFWFQRDSHRNLFRAMGERSLRCRMRRVRYY